MKKILTLTLCLFGLAFLGIAQTNIPATITTDQTWTASGSPYLLTQNTYADTGVYITIEPGVVVKSTSSGLTLEVAGALVAKGTSTKPIALEEFEIKFTSTSIGYNAVSGTGSQFDYCNIIGQGVGKRMINLSGMDIKVTNSNFTKGYYGIYTIGSATNTILVDNCTFDDFNNQGYPIYTSGSKATVKVTNSIFNNFYSIYTYGTLSYEKNTFNNFNKINFYAYGPSKVWCNSFTNAQFGVELTEYTNYDSAAGIDFSYNTLDSVGNNNYNGMVKYSNSNGSVNGINSKMNFNNFYSNYGQPIKVILAGFNSNKLTSESMDMRYNYWGTTDSSTIESYVKDYKDDINIFASANLSGALTTSNSSCGTGNKCNAEFTYSINEKKITLIDDSYALNDYTIVWNYGDGDTGTSNTHTYSKAGTYVVCLTIKDATTDCTDSICYQITIADGSSCKASYYLGRDSNNTYKLYIVNTSTGVTNNTKYTWTFGDGNGSNMQRPSHKYTKFGLFNVCLTIYDSAANCYSTYCDSIGLDSSGLILAATGFEVNVVEEWQLTSVDKVENLEVEVYPNPTNGKVNLVLSENLSKEATVLVLNQMGQVLLEDNFTGKESFDLSGMPNGLYFVRLQDANKTATVKVILSK